MPPKKQQAKQNNLRKGNESPTPAAASSVAPNPGQSDYRTQQQEELETLRAIYAEDFEQVEGKPAAWSKFADLAFNIRIKAGSDPNIAVTLSVQFPATYPKTIPILKIKDLQSGNPNVPSRLQNVIEAEPKARLGCEMIYDIILELQEILDDAANLKAGNEGLHSLEAERAAREADQERRTLEREQDLLRQVEDERAKEDRMIADQVEMERQKQRLALRPSAQEHITGEFLSQAPGGLDLSITSFDQPMTTKDAKDNDTFTFRSVWGRFNLLKARDKKITIVSPLTDHDVMVPQLLLKDIYLIEKSSESNNFRREMQVIEELLEASKIHRHVNVVDLLGYKIQRVPAGAASPPDVAATWELSILSEWANKGSLQELLELTGGLKAQQVRSWTHQILDALEFFDQNGYVHPALHAGNVLLFRSRTGEIHVKLSDGYGTALKTLVMLAKEQAGITQRTSPNWTAPELLAKSPQRTSKTCIWDLGVLILQMIFGADVAEVQYASPKQCIDGTDMSHALEDFIRKVLQTEPSRRPRAFDLSSFAFFQRQDEELLYSGSPLAPSTPYRRTRPSSSSALQTMSNFFFSRFEKEYEFVGKLGKGGFGEVVKARNRMDGEVYAIKKIFCESSEALAAMVSETKLLARLNHPFVVRYYGSWDEKEQLPEDAISSTTSQEAIASFDNDPFAVSSFGHDFMSSSNYRNIGIQFGDSDDDDEEDEEGRDALDAPESPQDQASKNFSTVEEADTREAINSQTQSQPLARRTSRFWQARPQKTTLYIQMEYCENRTLRHLIKDGLYNDTDKSWRLFHQILNGLAHIHANGIVHRDLKPDNIFISKEGYPRIGDFGLATTGLVTASARGSDALVAGPETRSIGTTYYVAPELGSKGSGKYSSKVDMYSLGIILFEMCHPLETSMERDRQLSQLREEHPTLPPTFQGPKLIVQGPTILRLLNHNQHERPSAAELLQTGHVSEPLEQEKIERYLDTIAGANPAVYEKALSSFFSRPTKKHVDLAWHDKTQGAANLAASLLAMSVKDSVISVFRRHGAVENDRQTILPRTDHYADCKPEAATFLDRSGMVVLLPYDLTMPFARSLGSTKLEYQKVFSIGEVFRRNHAPGLEPIGYPEVDFDIVSYNAIDLTLKEAEVIKVLDEIILELPGLRSKLISIHINHSDLLDMILEVCRIKPTQYDKVKSILAELNMDATTWTRIRAELRSDTINVPATSLDDLARFNFRDNLDGASRKLEALFEGTIYAGRLAQILARIESVMTFLVRFNVRSKVYIAPLSTNGDKTYHGSLLIQCMNESRKKRLAAGGRYDSIIAEYQPRGIAAQARAVGFRLNLGELVLSLTSEAKKPSAAKLKSGPTFSPTLTTRRCEVLLTSPDGNIRRGTCVELISRLWANGISAELTEDFASMEELESAYHRDPHTFVVTVRYDSGAIGERSIKARNISKKEDTEVLATDLVNWIKGEIRERKHREGERQDAGTKLKREISMNESSALVGESREPDVLVLSPLHRGKKTNRRQIIDAAGTKTRELATSMLTDAPIVAIETSDEIIDFMRNTRLSDPESWRNLTQSAPLQERKYLQQVQEMLQEVATEGKRGAFVFNYRTRACIYYDLDVQAGLNFADEMLQSGSYPPAQAIWFLGVVFLSIFSWSTIASAEAHNGAATNASLLWGPYRPNLYFGVRPRIPQSLLTGLMWAKVDNLATVQNNFRHTCEQHEGMAGYGWEEYDIRNGGRQVIHDAGNNLDLTIDFLKVPGGSHGGNWAARIKGVPQEDAPANLVTTVVFYAGMEGLGSFEFINEPQDLGQQGSVTIHGQTTNLGDFEITITPGPDNTPPVRSHDSWAQKPLDRTLAASAQVPAEAIWQAKNIIFSLMKPEVDDLVDQYGQENMPPPWQIFTIPNDIKEGNFHVVQKVFQGPFEFDILYNSASAPKPVTSEDISKIGATASESFKQKFATIFAPKAPFDSQKYTKFSQAMLSNLVGGIGYFYGDSLVDRSYATEYEEENEGFWEETAAARAQGQIKREGPAELFTNIPSRPFFPRGFLWDEGFHLIPIAEWDMDLTLEIVQSWFNLMDEDGWIAREQILGSEARSKVPQEFQVQYPHYANPPTLFMILESFVDKLNAKKYDDVHASELKDRIRKFYPLLKRQYFWFRKTQRGDLKSYDRDAFSTREAYRWRGRTVRHILTSGIDDYPRPQPPHPGELHTDLISWVGMMTRSLRRLAESLGEGEDVTEFQGYETAIIRNIDDLHWSSANKTFCDATIDDYEESVHVCHKGYVSIFPFMTGLLPADSPRIKPILDLISDPEELWSEFGVRSLSKKDEFYGTDENYWRSPIWINMNYLIVKNLLHLAATKGPHQKQAREIYSKLRTNLVENVFREWEKTGFAWEQYNPETGDGQRTQHFTGWTSLVVNIMVMPDLSKGGISHGEL